jgi:DNA-binding transcriptional MerR regulator
MTPRSCAGWQSSSARQYGFSLKEIQKLFTGFKPGASASQRWQQLSQRKLAELDASMERIKLMQNLLRRMNNCRCDALDECGAGLLRLTDSARRSTSSA